MKGMPGFRRSLLPLLDTKALCERRERSSYSATLDPMMIEASDTWLR